MSTVFRPMDQKDVDALARLESALQPLMPWSKQQIQEALYLPGYICYIAEFNDELIGYMIASYGVDMTDLLLIGVSPQYQQKGIASGLLAKLKQLVLAQAINKIFLEVRESNHAAIALYRKLGFEQAGCRKNYYLTETGKEHAITMIADIGEKG